MAIAGLTTGIVFFLMGLGYWIYIFVIIGLVAKDKAGSATMLSFVVAGLACSFAAFCYAEFASMVPVAGSAYTYAYATLGELFAWIIGWDCCSNTASAPPALPMVGRTTLLISLVCLESSCDRNHKPFACSFRFSRNSWRPSSLNSCFVISARPSVTFRPYFCRLSSKVGPFHINFSFVYSIPVRVLIFVDWTEWASPYRVKNAPRRAEKSALLKVIKTSENRSSRKPNIKSA